MTRWILQLAALWLAFSALVALTGITLLAFFHRADCSGSTGTINAAASQPFIGQCTRAERISALVRHHSTYFQSVHIILLESTACLALLVLQPFLWSRTWNLLTTKQRGAKRHHCSLNTLQASIELSHYPQIMPGVSMVLRSRKLSMPTLLVIAIGLLSTVAPLAVSSIYKPHIGSFEIPYNFSMGGGVGPEIPPTFDPGYIVGGGVIAGRALINAQTALLKQSNDISPPNFMPFLTSHDVQLVSSGQIQVAVASPTVTCDASAAEQLPGFPIFIDPDDFYWGEAAGNSTLITLDGVEIGYLLNEPQLSSFYANINTTSKPGYVESTSTIVFLAANGTIEGAQQHIVAPNTTSRIRNIDILVCSSTVQLQVSNCSLSNGFVESCTATDPNTLADWTDGGLDPYVTNPITISQILSAAPVTYGYSGGQTIPLYSLNPQLLDAELPPLSFFSLNTAEAPYNISKDYILNAMFTVTMKGLIQGMLTAWQTYNVHTVKLLSEFATSDYVVQIVILVVALLCATVVTIASIVANSTLRTFPLDFARVLAISRDPELDNVFLPYSKRDAAFPTEVMNLPLVYEFNHDFGRHALAIVERPDAIIPRADSFASHSKSPLLEYEVEPLELINEPR